MVKHPVFSNIAFEFILAWECASNSRAIYTERQRQCCSVPSDIAVMKKIQFLIKQSESLSKLIANPMVQALTLTLQINHQCLVETALKFSFTLKELKLISQTKVLYYF